MSDRALDGVRVIDLAGEMGAYGTRLLADLGALVIKVEPKGGDGQRLRPPLMGTPERTSVVFEYYNANKKGVELDLADPAAEGDLATLAAGADIVFISPSARNKIVGWDPANRSLSWADPNAIICCLTPFGINGPLADRRATHFTSFAASGQMSSIGTPDGPPLAIPAQPFYHELSTHAATAAMLALRERPAVGGQVIDLALHDMLAYRYTVSLSVYLKAGVLPPPRLAMLRRPPSGVYDAADGSIEFLVYNPSHWDGFVELMGRPPELVDPKLRDRGVRNEYAELIGSIMESTLAKLNVEDVVSRAQELRIPCAPRNTPAQLVTDSQLISRGYWIEQPSAVLGSFHAPGPPFKSTTTLFGDRGRAPALGEDNAEFLSKTEASPRPRAVGPRIQDVRVLSFGTAIAGNVSATTLAEMGADVVKIESPVRPDPLRIGPIWGDFPRVFEPSGAETNLTFAGYSRSCRSIPIDMNDATDKADLLRLVGQADVLIDNFASGVMERWGISHEALSELNPRLIMVSVSGYGRTGPKRDYMAYGLTVNSFSGLTKAWASHSGQFDYTAVAHVLFAIFAALAHRDRTGQGSIVDIAQAEAGIAILAPLYLPALNSDDKTLPELNSVPGSYFATVVRCAGQDTWLAIELEDRQDWNIAAEVIGHPELVAADGPSAPDAKAEMLAAISAWSSDLTPTQAADRLQRGGLAAAAVAEIRDLTLDGQIWARDTIGTVHHPDLGDVQQARPFQRFSKSPMSIRRPTARLGEHRADVLREWTTAP